jgi:thiol-disulfide isomerase/thioredoxin/outer membrane lipoprotein-sorting protein
MRVVKRMVGRILGLWVFGLSTVAGFSQQQPDDALKLLDRVAKHYEDAETVHIEMTEQGTAHAPLYDSRETKTLSAYEALGGRFRYEGTSWGGSGLIVSDGTDEWHLRRSFHQFSKQPAGTYFKQQNALSGDDGPILSARDLRRNLNSLGSGLRSAHFLPDEAITIGDRKVECAVVHYNEKDYTRQTPGYTSETSLWIDRATLTLLKEEIHSHGRLSFGNLTPPDGTVLVDTYARTYTVVEINFKPEVEIFSFIAPKGATEVAALPDPFGRTNTSPTQKPAADEVGKMSPEIKLVDEAGHEVELSSYRGHPLLIDVWATWCGPCMEELPLLNRIRKATAGTDLKITAIDEDSEPGVAATLLKRREYDWEDFHFNPSVRKGLPTSGIPLLVLIDATGKIVYYHTGTGDESAMIAAIAKLGKDYEAVSSVR